LAEQIDVEKITPIKQNLDKWKGSQKHNSYDILKMYILKS